MTRVVYFTACTLDGFIADEHDSLDLPGVPGVDVRFVSGPVTPVYDELVAAADGRDVWLIGGGDLVGQLADAGLLDVEGG